MVVARSCIGKTPLLWAWSEEAHVAHTRPDRVGIGVIFEHHRGGRDREQNISKPTTNSHTAHYHTSIPLRQSRWARAAPHFRAGTCDLGTFAGTSTVSAIDGSVSTMEWALAWMVVTNVTKVSD